CGSYTADLNLYDVIIAEDAWSESTFARTQGVSEADILEASPALVAELESHAKALQIEFTKGRIHSSDVFYRQNFDDYQTIRDQHGCQAVEMEAFALFANAQATNKQAACVLTVSDSLVTHEATTAAEREQAFTNMMKIALEMAA
ncbi:MAG: purine nucleoside phosphorylase DeoD-type, partial [Pseudomonadales bacterium]